MLVEHITKWNKDSNVFREKFLQKLPKVTIVTDDEQDDETSSGHNAKKFLVKGCSTLTRARQAQKQMLPKIDSWRAR